MISLDIEETNDQFEEKIAEIQTWKSLLFNAAIAYIIPMVIIYTIGDMIAWMRRGFAKD